MENNTTNTTSENEASKPVKEKKDNKNDNKKSLSSTFNVYKGEFRKITWPTKNDLIKETVTVIILSLVVGVIIFGYDEAFTFVLKKIVELMS